MQTASQIYRELRDHLTRKAREFAEEEGRRMPESLHALRDKTSREPDETVPAARDEDDCDPD